MAPSVYSLTNPRLCYNQRIYTIMEGEEWPNSNIPMT